MSSFRVRVSALLVCLVSAGLAQADRLPHLSADTELVPLESLEQLVLPALDIDALLEEDRRIEEGKDIVLPHRVAGAIEVVAGLHGNGNWQELADGGLLWRLRVQSPGATDLNFGLRRFVVPEGATFHVISELNGFFQGPYGHQDVKKHGELWTAVVPGDRAVLELHLPPGTEMGAEGVELELMQVGHGFRDLFDLFEGPLETHQGSCNNDVICPEGDPWRDPIQAVGVMMVGGTWNCTGTMLMDVPRSFRNWFLTADHCGIRAGNAASVVTYWNFESPTCGALSGGSLDQNQSGATFRATYQPSDFTLLELDADPLPEFNVYYSGWDRTDDIPVGSVAIHHPSNDEKAISFNDDPLTYTGSCIGRTTDTHWTVDNWEDGTTEPGSSGSGLFHPDTQLLIGDLSGGGASCTRIDIDCYGRFAVSWTGGGSAASRLSDWLDPSGGGDMTVDGSYVGTRLRETGRRFVDSCALGAGDRNGAFEPGETIDIFYTLEASDPVTGVSGRLTSTSPEVTILNDTVSWGALAGGEAREGSAFQVRVADDACFAELDFQVEITADGGLGPFELGFSEVVGSPISADVPLAIPDEGQIASTLSVSGVTSFTDIDVRVQIDHSWVGDLIISLRHPDGREVVLLDRPGVPDTDFGCGNDNLVIVFDDDSAVDLEGSCPGDDPWYDGLAQPVEPLSNLLGASDIGDWELVVSDNAGDDTGSIVDWGLITTPPLDAGECQPCTDVIDCPGQVVAAGTLRVRKLADFIEVSLPAAASDCATGIAVLIADDPRPAVGAGSFPTDPSFVDISAEDIDPGLAFLHPPTPGIAYYLAVETLPDGTYGPSGHYGR
ncbi:MAG: proprotein convertase P-domain-containing protein [Acidobacteriota bacterium]